MPNIYKFIKSEKWGKTLTFLSVCVILCGMGSFIFAQGAKASKIETGVQNLENDVTEIKASIPTSDDLREDYVTRSEWDKINEEREKRFTEAKQSLERSMEQMRAEQHDFQTEQRAVNREILKLLSDR